MRKTKVTSIRLDADLLEKATAFGLNISRVCEASIQNEINKQLLDENIIVPRGINGISKNSRVIMDGRKFKSIKKIKAGEKVLSQDVFSNKLETANVIDVGPLTSDEAVMRRITIKNSSGTMIQALPDTPIFCWTSSLSQANWIAAKDVKQGFLAKSVSCKSSGGSTHIMKVEKEYVQDVFYRLEVYPNNNFFANSNVRRKLHYIDDLMPSVWTFPVKGYLGQIGTLLEQNRIT